MVAWSNRGMPSGATAMMRGERVWAGSVWKALFFPPMDAQKLFLDLPHLILDRGAALRAGAEFGKVDENVVTTMIENGSP